MGPAGLSQKKLRIHQLTCIASAILNKGVVRISIEGSDLQLRYANDETRIGHELDWPSISG